MLFPLEKDYSCILVTFPLSHFSFFAILTIKLLLPLRYPSVESFVRTHYPTHPWEHEKFVHSHVKAVYTPQLFMARILRSIFPNKEVVINLRAPLDIRGEHGKPLEIDVFIPELSLGFEYQVFFLGFSFFFLPKGMGRKGKKERKKEMKECEKN